VIVKNLDLNHRSLPYQFFAVTEGDDPASAARDIFKFVPFLEYTIYPVLDIGEAAGRLAEAGRPGYPGGVLST
jgi:hypothetical protein